MTKITVSKEKVINFLKKQVMIFVLIGIMILFTILNPVFFSFNNLMNIVKQNAAFIIATIGVAIIMISGGTDLSVGKAMAVSAICMALFILKVGMPIWLAMILAILVAVVLGAFNGFISNLLKIHPMIITLATMTIFEGLAYLIGESKTYIGFPDSFKFLGQAELFGFLPVSALIVAAVAIIVGFVLKFTYFGRHIYAVGGNPEASRLAGINVTRVKLFVFIIAYVLIGIATLIAASRAVSVSAATGAGMEFNAITACVLGGISFIGGEGKVKDAVVGSLILGVLTNGMLLAGWGTYYQYIVKGIILISAIGFDTYQKKSKAKKAVVKEPAKEAVSEAKE